MRDTEKELMFAKFDALRTEIDLLRSSTENDIVELRRLKEHDIAALNLRFEDNKTNLDAALKTVDDANKLAAKSIELRFEGVNEFRRTLADQTNTFIPRPEVAAAIDSLQRELETVKISQSKTSTMAEANEKLSAVTAADLDQRLHEINEFRSQLKDQTQTFLTRNEFSATLLPIADKIDKLGRPNYTLFLGLASLLIVLASAAWAVIGLQIQVANAPLTSIADQSSVDRAQLNAHVARLDTELSTTIQNRTKEEAQLDIEIAQLKAQLPTKAPQP